MVDVISWSCHPVLRSSAARYDLDRVQARLTRSTQLLFSALQPAFAATKPGEAPPVARSLGVMAEMAHPPLPDQPIMETMTNTHWCNGTALHLHGGGTWHGHVYPGLIFLGWGLWWAFHTFRLHLRSRHLGDGPFQSQPWYAASFRWLRFIEPFLKAFVTPLGILVELRLDHPYFLNLLCREDGSFAMRHIHNWQHASSYPGFIVSGLVDFLGMLVPLPAGTQQAFLALSFGLEAFLMLMHKKHEALDEVVHWLLAMTMAAAAVFVLLELRHKNKSFLISCGRCFAVMMQGAWLMSMGEMMYADSVAWRPGPGAQMMAPVAFAMVVLAMGVCMLLAYVGMQVYYERLRGYRSLPTLQDHDPHEFKGLPMEDMGRGFSGDDSANEQSEGSEGHTTPPQKLHGSSSGGSQQQASGRRQLVMALSSMRSSEARGPPRNKPNDHII